MFCFFLFRFTDVFLEFSFFKGRGDEGETLFTQTECSTGSKTRSRARRTCTQFLVEFKANASSRPLIFTEMVLAQQHVGLVPETSSVSNNSPGSRSHAGLWQWLWLVCHSETHDISGFWCFYLVPHTQNPCNKQKIDL